MSYNCIESLSNVPLTPATHAKLTELACSGNHISGAELHRLRGFPRLQKLALVDDLEGIEELGFKSYDAYASYILQGNP